MDVVEIGALINIVGEERNANRRGDSFLHSCARVRVGIHCTALHSTTGEGAEKHPCQLQRMKICHSIAVVAGALKARDFA